MTRPDKEAECRGKPTENEWQKARKRTDRDVKPSARPAPILFVCRLRWSDPRIIGWRRLTLRRAW